MNINRINPTLAMLQALAIHRTVRVTIAGLAVGSFMRSPPSANEVPLRLPKHLAWIIPYFLEVVKDSNGRLRPETSPLPKIAEELASF